MGLSCQYSNKIISKVKNYTKIAICKWTNAQCTTYTFITPSLIDKESRTISILLPKSMQTHTKIRISI